MIDYTRLKEAIAEVIRNNDRQEITGDLLQQELFNMIDAINETKQDNIDDLDAIRAGAAAGSTAYQKPADGIPKTDLDAGVQDSLDKADTALQQHQSLDDCVQVNAQSFTDAQKTQARDNIGAGDAVEADILADGVVSQTLTWTLAADGGYDYSLSNITRGKISKAEIARYVSLGATFNTSTGYFELNGITDIALDEIRDIYAAYSPVLLPQALYKSNLRTIFPTMGESEYSVGALAYLAQYLKSIPLLKGYPYIVTVGGNLFLKCSSLEVCEMEFYNIRNDSTLFQECYRLKSIKLRATSRNVWFGDSPLLLPSSVAFMVNTAGTPAFTITLHPTAYAAAMADTAVQTALAAHTNVTLASA